MAIRIFDAQKDPLGKMLNDYHMGNHDAFLNVWSSTLEMSSMPAAIMFREEAEMDPIDRLALDACSGRILDVGGGAGCHSLALQKRGHEVDAIDISPGCVELMQKRGLGKVFHRNLLELTDVRYDTILMMMNGLGICGSVDGLHLFIDHLDSLLAPEGQIIADSTDLTSSYLAQGDEIYDEEGIYCGETNFAMIYKGMRSDPFDWVYLDFELLQTVCTFHGFVCNMLFEADNGQFLARICRM